MNFLEMSELEKLSLEELMNYNSKLRDEITSIERDLIWAKQYNPFKYEDKITCDEYEKEHPLEVKIRKFGDMILNKYAKYKLLEASKKKIKYEKYIEKYEEYIKKIIK